MQIFTVIVTFIFPLILLRPSHIASISEVIHPYFQFEKSVSDVGITPNAEKNHQINKSVKKEIRDERKYEHICVVSEYKCQITIEPTSAVIVSDTPKQTPTPTSFITASPTIPVVTIMPTLYPQISKPPLCPDIACKATENMPCMYIEEPNVRSEGNCSCPCSPQLM